MLATARHWHQRELRFLGLVGISLGLIALHLSAGLRLAGQEGTGWRKIDLPALERRIETGELRDKEAEWYHPHTGAPAAGGMP
jgi:hypothetical protein